MKKRKRRGRKAAGTKKIKGALKKKRVVRRKRAARKAVAPEAPAPAPPYAAPRRTEIKEAVCALLPHVDPRLIKKLDYWALYTIHQDVVKSGKDAEALARRLIRGYDPSKALPVQAPAAEGAATMTAKEEERAMRTKDLENRKMDARKRELAARERARVAKEQARAKAQAAKARERAARDAARAKRLGAAKPAAAAPKASPAAPSAPAARPVSARVPAGTYVAPVRTRIREELLKVMPMISSSDLTGLDYWALYTMHSRICKYGDAPESMARKFCKNYKKK